MKFGTAFTGRRVVQCDVVEAVILIGIQGSGKSTFYKEKFADTHVRINLDMLRTKNREKALFEACLEAKIKFVVDKVNASREERARYIDEAKRFGLRIVGYYLRSDMKSALERNSRRTGKARIPDKGLFDSAKRLQIPNYDEGFDELNYVWIDEEGRFVIEPWKIGDMNPVNTLTIRSDEHEIVGKWIDVNGRVDGDESCKRVEQLTSSYLEKLGNSLAGGGWETLFRDSNDGRLWERWYPEGHLQGGGPPALRTLSVTEAEEKYPNVLAEKDVTPS